MKLLAAILLVTSLAGAVPAFYVGQQQYRFDKDDPHCREHQMCSFEEHHDNEGHAYSLNFIEVKDDGTLFDSKQLDAAREQLRAARVNGQQPTVFIYIHGWHNNADELGQGKHPDCSDSPYNGDVAKFRACGLQVFANDAGPAKPGVPPRIVGIYLAWHGTDFAWPPFSIIPSYPLRRGAARDVGETGMTHALQGIFDVVNEDRDAYFVIAMGHSFGARVLEAADETVDPKHPQAGLIQKYRSGQQPLSSNAVVPRLPVDLIFYVNAATSHSVSLKTIKDWKEKCASSSRPVGCDKDPLYLSVSSRADLLTAIVMPIANIVFFSPLTDQYHLISAANTPWLQTHKIPVPVDDCKPSPPRSTFCFGVPASKTSINYHRVDPKPGRNPALFWAMNSDHWIASLEGTLHGIPVFRRLIMRHWVISSHGDVWNTGVFNMLRAVIHREELNARARVTGASNIENR
jgi:hypothetical protein